MTLTFDINPDAVWEDGTPITWEDFECSWQAQLNTPGSIETSGYDAVSGVAAGENDQQVIISFNRVYAPYKGIFDAIIKKAAVADCMDISTDFETELPISARPYMISSFGENELELVPNPNWWGDPPVAERVLITGFADQETELAAINSGEVDFIYPQFFQGITDAVTDPNVVPAITFGGDYEALYFQMGEDEAYAARSPTMLTVTRSFGRSTVKRCSSRSTPRSSRVPSCSSAARSFPVRTAPMHGPTSPTTRKARRRC